MRSGLRGSSPLARQRGVALLTALLVVAIATIAAVAMTREQGLAIRRAENIRNAEQAWQYALGLEAYARARLHEDGVSADDVDALNENWAAGPPPLPVPGGRLSGRLADRSGLFNINSLLGVHAEVQAERFRRLLAVLGLDPALEAAVRDWLDADPNARAGGAEDPAYGGLRPSYRAANARMVDPSELRLVLGVDQSAWERLSSHVTALPDPDTEINVNTATVPVLRSLAEGISGEQARDMARAAHTGFRTVRDFLEQRALRGLAVPRQGLSVASRYFEAVGVVQLGDDVFHFHSLIHRPEHGPMTVLARWRGSP